MHILDVSQENNRAEWLMERVGRVTGTKAGDIVQCGDTLLQPLSGFWELMAETIADPPTMENAAERGHRLENDNAALVLDKEGIDPDTAVFDAGMWVDDEEERIACSPDVYQNSEHPTWAVECKSLSSANHLSAVVPYMTYLALSQPDKYPMASREQLDALRATAASLLGDCMPVETEPSIDILKAIPDKYVPQAVQYFVVNPDLETLYFSFYDPRIQIDILQHVYVPIKRTNVDRAISIYRAAQVRALQRLDTLRVAMEQINDEDIF